MTIMNILGCDPGSRNFGYGVVQTKLVGKKQVFRVRECGILDHPLKSIKPDDLKVGRKQFLAEIKSLLQPNSKIIGERFQTRGVNGVTIELVNFMLAFMYGAFPQADMRMITASQWKHWVNKSAGLEKLIRRVKMSAKAKQTPLAKLYKYSLCEPHELDAVLMALFLSYTERGIVPFEDMSAKDWQRIVDQCEAASTIPITQQRIAKRG